MPHLFHRWSGIEHIRAYAGGIKWSGDALFHLVPNKSATAAIPPITTLNAADFLAQGKQVCQTIVDATTCGNVSRFFNHCCDPTLSVFVVSICQDWDDGHFTAHPVVCSSARQLHRQNDYLCKPFYVLLRAHELATA